PYDAQIRFPISDHTTSQNVVLPVRRYDAVEALLDQIDLVGPVGRAGHTAELHQTPHWPHPTTPTGHEQHTVSPLPLIPDRQRDATGKGRVGPRKTVPEVHHVEREAVWLQDAPGAERVLDLIVIALQC